MAHSRICHCRLSKPKAKSSRDKYKYHIYQPFFQPGQLTWLHMHGLSFTPKFLALMSARARYLKQPSQPPPSILICIACERPAIIGRTTNQCHVCFNFSCLSSDCSPPLAFTISLIECTHLRRRDSPGGRGL